MDTRLRAGKLLVDDRGDLFAPVLTCVQPLPSG
jgi:hypothetical protein